jgi:hypothetical protein
MMSTCRRTCRWFLLLSLQRIWPTSGDIEWPTLPPLTNENVNQLITAFDHIQPLERLSDKG